MNNVPKEGELFHKPDRIVINFDRLIKNDLFDHNVSLRYNNRLSVFWHNKKI